MTLRRTYSRVLHFCNVVNDAVRNRNRDVNSSTAASALAVCTETMIDLHFHHRPRDMHQNAGSHGWLDDMCGDKIDRLVISTETSGRNGRAEQAICLTFLGFSNFRSLCTRPRTRVPPSISRYWRYRVVFFSRMSKSLLSCFRGELRLSRLPLRLNFPSTG